MTMVNQMSTVTIMIITNLQAINSGESLEEKEAPRCLWINTMATACKMDSLEPGKNSPKRLSIGSDIPTPGPIS